MTFFLTHTCNTITIKTCHEIILTTKIKKVLET
nr:MAG TPA: hypothetical protein [Caudoviricetes sp.]